MLKAIDLDESIPTAMPDVPNKTTLQKFTISIERHEAYANMWNTATYLGVLANTAFWLFL
tara:strand:+ start:342 stop:521 length:180 start_codon:yes stop_codon:yes gene_type:complete